MRLTIEILNKELVMLFIEERRIREVCSKQIIEDNQKLALKEIESRVHELTNTLETLLLVESVIDSSKK